MTRSRGSAGKLYGENTLIFYIWGDDGPSAQGQNGTISELTAHNVAEHKGMASLPGGTSSWAATSSTPRSAQSAR